MKIRIARYSSAQKKTRLLRKSVQLDEHKASVILSFQQESKMFVRNNECILISAHK